MNLTVDEAYLRAQRRRAGQVQALGYGLVILSLVLSVMMSTTTLLWVVLLAYPALIIGFPLSQAGRGRARRWKLASAMPALVRDAIQPGPKQQLYSYIPLGGERIDYLLLAPEGLFVIELKGITEDVKGRYPVRCQQVDGKDVWTQRLPIFERLARMGEAPLGNPSAALDAKIGALKVWLAGQGWGEEVPVYGLVVFREAGTPLEIEGCQYEVLHLDEIRTFLGMGHYFDQPLRPAIPTDERNRLNTALRAAMGLGPALPTPAVKAPTRKLSPAARAEQERVAAIRAARAEQANPTADPKAGGEKTRVLSDAPQGAKTRRLPTSEAPQGAKTRHLAASERPPKSGTSGPRQGAG
jgi:hypothetical protein